MRKTSWVFAEGYSAVDSAEQFSHLAETDFNVISVQEADVLLAEF